jgi:hypothetical protein
MKRGDRDSDVARDRAFAKKQSNANA